MRFDFATTGRIIFGPGSVAQLPALAGSFGKRALFVTGRNGPRVAPVRETLRKAGIECVALTTSGEPTVGMVREGARIATASECELVIAIGGGSAIDAGKAIAIVAENGGEPLDYLEVVGRGNTLAHPGLPFIAVPTTAGTGAEVTRNSVLGSPEHGIKASLRSPLMLAKVALVDPELSYGLSPEITAQTGLDAFTQLIEAYVCRNASPFTDSMCEAGLRKVPVALTAAQQNDPTARENMAYASLLSGLALANAGLGVVHGFAGPAGGMMGAPHGAICAALLAAGVRGNLRALGAREPQNPALAKYAQLADLLGTSYMAAWIDAFVGKFRMPGLGSLGLKRDQIPELVAKAEKASSMKANPIVLTRGELTAIVEESF